MTARPDPPPPLSVDGVRLPPIAPPDPRDAQPLPGLAAVVGKGYAMDYLPAQALADAGASVAPAGGDPVATSDARPPADAVLGEVCSADLNIALVARWAEDAGKPQLAEHLRALGCRRAFRRTFMRRDRSPQRTVRTTRVSAGVLRQLRDTELCEPVPSSRRVEYVSKLKLVPKRGSEAHLWRVILATVELNDACLEPPRAPIPSLRDVIDGVLRGSWAVVGDLRSWFFQFAVARSVSQVAFVFDIRGKLYSFTRMPMGWRWAPYIATATSQLIWQRAASGARYATVWIDDSIVSVDTQAEASATRDRLARECATVNAVMKRWDVSQRFVYVGMEFDLMARRARLSDAFVISFGECVRRLSSPYSLSAAWSAAGGAVWAAYAMRWAYAPLASILADIATAHAEGARPFDAFAMSQRHVDMLSAVKDKVAEREWFAPYWTPVARSVVASDASPYGLGFIINGGVERAVPFQLPRCDHRIQQRVEAIAALAALRELQAPPHSEVILLTDNSGLAYRLARWSAPPCLADVVCEIWRLCATRRWRLRVGWIPGDSMPADALSRSDVPVLRPSSVSLLNLVAGAFFPPGAGSVQPVPLPFV